MKPILDILDERVAAVMSELAGGEAVAAIVKPTQDGRFGDYQANGVMGLAKRLKQNPRQLAEAIVAKLDVSDLCESVDIAGPGFINFKLKASWLGEQLLEAIADHERLGVDAAGADGVTVVDFSGPNIAKQMHVGHLRSTIIGDVIARVLGFWSGDESSVVRQNHVGDWGTQFGMLVSYQLEHPELMHGTGSGNYIADLEGMYQAAYAKFNEDEAFKQKAYQAVVSLHNGDKEVLDAWQFIVDRSLDYCQEIYEQLNVKLTKEDVRGESAYNPTLPDVIAGLKEKDMLVESDGAGCVFMEQFKNKDGEKLPLIVQKSDGAFLYATTDLAAIRYRVSELKAKRVVYVTDARQKLHFDMVFNCARQAGWAGEDVLLEHVPFGSVMGENGPLKTRTGGNVKLKDLLDESQSRALKVVEEKNPDIATEKKQAIADVVGIGAVKYADLSNNLVSDYVFSWDKMLAMEGNTAPYMQYAYARVQSIFRKGEVDVEELLAGNVELELDAAEELSLVKQLLRYGEVIETVARELRPHLLTTYLFDVAQQFSSFYSACPVLKSEGAKRVTRLMLCYHTARVIEHGLGLLGIKTIEQM